MNNVSNLVQTDIRRADEVQAGAVAVALVLQFSELLAKVAMVLYWFTIRRRYNAYLCSSWWYFLISKRNTNNASS